MVRKVVAYELLSLDGCAEEPSEFIADFDDVMEENLGRVIADQDVVLLGRRTYDEWASFWPSSDIEPFASFINSVQKYVVTSTKPVASWANTTVIGDGLSDTLAALKQQAGADIGVHGSVSLMQSLLADGLVDELRLVVSPVLHGRGRKLFDGGLSTRLTLTRCVTSPSGCLLLDYDVAH